MQNKIYIGFDPGKKGGISFILGGGEVISYHQMPTIGKKEYDIQEIKRLIREFQGEYALHAGLEDVHAIQGGMVGATSQFQFGRGKGILEGILAGMEVPHTLIQPKAWQKSTWDGVTKITTPTKRKLKDGSFARKIDSKATSLVAAKRLFPKETFLATSRSKVPHDGIVDSLLIAEHCRRLGL